MGWGMGLFDTGVGDGVRNQYLLMFMFPSVFSSLLVFRVLYCELLLYSVVRICFTFNYLLLLLKRNFSFLIMHHNFLLLIEVTKPSRYFFVIISFILSQSHCSHLFIHQISITSSSRNSLLSFSLFKESFAGVEG